MTEYELGQFLKEFPKAWEQFWMLKKDSFNDIIQNARFDSGATYAGEIRFWFTILYDKYAGGKCVRFFIRTKAQDVFNPGQKMWIDDAGKLRASTPETLEKLRLLYLAWLALKRIEYSLVNEDAMYKDFLHSEDLKMVPIVQVTIEENHLKYDVC